MRERIVELGLVTILAVVLGTELLSAVHWLGRAAVIALWAGIAAMWAIGLRRQKWDFGWEWLPVGGIWAIEGLTALVSPPNSSDAMAYHMPRIIYWMQQHSVENFATPYLNQIMLQPLHEYVVMHLQLLSNGDRFANCVAWMSTAAYVIAASLVARALGAGVRGQGLAAFCAATLPNGIMQASGVKNEALLSFLLSSMVYFCLQKRRWAVGAACALACFTKGTAYLFCAPLLLLLLPKAVPQVALLLLLVNGAFYWRNIDLSGSPLGFDSAQADGKYRWRNEYLSWQPMASNVMRHLSEQLGARDEAWNRQVFQATVGVHGALGLGVNDPAMTWPYTEFIAPRLANHETDSNNRWHLLLLGLSALYFAWRREKLPLLIVAAMAAGAMAFCFYLKWQPFMSRMWLPLFSLGMSVVGLALGRIAWPLQAVVTVFLLSGSRLPLMQNWVRPLRGPATLFTLSREDLYYQDMRQWPVRKQYEEVVRKLRTSACREIAIDINQFQLEYPVQALLLREHPETRFVHVNTQNPSKKYEGRMAAVKPCVQVCLACDRWLEPLANQPLP